MLENLLDSLNALLLQHPPLIQLLHLLFWVKYWLLTVIMSVFVCLVYSENTVELSDEAAAKPSAAEHTFIA
jgi:hypothetical protein